MFNTKKRWAPRGIYNLVLGGLALGALLLGAQPASALEASVCMQTNYLNHGNTQSLTCTANDVSVARATNISISSGGSCTGTGANKVCTCNEGGNVTFTADYEVVLTAQARYDIGIYFSADGDLNGDGALTGQCKLTTLDAQNSSNPINLDAKPGRDFQLGDVCGDIDSTHNPQLLHLTLTVPCQPDPTSGKLKLPNCTSWRQSGANEVCDEATDAFPGSPSKCNCEPGFTVDIFTEVASIDVTKSANPTSVPETGGNVTYTVTVTNNSAQASLTLDSLTDNPYGDITTTGHNGISATTCALVTIPAEANDVSNQNPYTCTFTVAMTGGNTGQQITDIVTACGTDSFGNTNRCDTGEATITISDTSTPPSVTIDVKSASSTVDVTYKVVVTNNSTIDTMTLKQLCDDKFGDISTGQSSNPPCAAGTSVLVSTACPTLPAAIGVSPGNVTCEFVGRVTTSPYTDKVTANLTDDDGVNYQPDDTATVTVTVTSP